MKLVSFTRAGAIGYGVHLGDAVLDLRLAAALAGDPALPTDMIGFIATGATGLATARRLLAATGVVEAARVSADEVRLLAPIPRPAKNVFCVGRNYVDHVAEGYRARGTETKLPEFPQFFTKPPTAVIGPDETFTHDPSLTQMLDYEVELAVVIGTRGRDIPAAACAGARIRLHHRQRHHRARSATPARPMVQGQGPRSILPARALDRDRRRDPGLPRHRAVFVRQRRAAAERQGVADDLRHSRPSSPRSRPG